MNHPKNNRGNNEEFLIFADELEQRWKQSLPRYTGKEFVEIFSPPPEMIRTKLEDRWKERGARIEAIKTSLKKIHALEIDNFSRWFGELIIKTFLLPDLEKCNRHIARLRQILNILNPQNLTKNNDQEAVENARKYPIYEIAKYRLLLRGCGNKFSSLCPFHEEKHASFYIYPETNTFHCFGCQENGDIIKLTMHLYGISFREAVKMLQ